MRKKKIWMLFGPHPLRCEAICPHHATHQGHGYALQGGRGSLGEGAGCGWGGLRLPAPAECDRLQRVSTICLETKAWHDTTWGNQTQALPFWSSTDYHNHIFALQATSNLQGLNFPIFLLNICWPKAHTASIPYFQFYPFRVRLNSYEMCYIFFLIQSKLFL